MANQSIRLTNSSIVSALNNKADIELENSSKAAAIESLANSAATTANAASKVADAAVDLIEVQLPLKVNKSGDTFNGNVVIDGNLTVTGDVNIPADGISGSVEVATSATKDSNGNVIVDTYLNKLTGGDISGGVRFTSQLLMNNHDNNPGIWYILNDTATKALVHQYNYNNDLFQFMRQNKQTNTFSSAQLYMDRIPEGIFATIPTIIESSKGTSWYIKYDNGFIIQGGYKGNSGSNYTLTKTVLTFPIAFSSTAYSFTRTDKAVSAKDVAGPYQASYYSKTTTQIICPNDDVAIFVGFNWLAMGF